MCALYAQHHRILDMIFQILKGKVRLQAIPLFKWNSLSLEIYHFLKAFLV